MFVLKDSNIEYLINVANTQHTVVPNIANFFAYGSKEKFEEYVQQRVPAIAYPIQASVFTTFEIHVADHKASINVHYKGDIGLFVPKGLDEKGFLSQGIGSDVEIVSATMSFDDSKFSNQVTHSMLRACTNKLTPEMFYTLVDCKIRSTEIESKIHEVLKRLIQSN